MKIRRLKTFSLVLLLLLLATAGQFALGKFRRAPSLAMTDGVLAALGGVRSIAAEVIWFRADRLQEEGRYVEMAQLASMLTFMEPHTPEVWSYAAWNLAYNISVMMPTDEDRWRWVLAAIRLLRDEGLALNPRSRELYRELAWLFELKIGADIDSASPLYREKWKAIVEDVKKRGAWEELKMDPKKMLTIEHASGYGDWTDPQLSAMYWAALGGHRDIYEQAAVIYRKNRAK
jgi:hypothetical protein